jgi:hypothetical protein
MSHNHKDKPFVRDLAAKLSLFGIKAWVDEWEMLPGDSLIGKIQEGIEACDYVGAVLSKHSVSSEWVAREVRAALTGEIEYKKVIVIPMRIDNCKLPPFLRDKLFADFRTDFYVGFCELLRRLLGDEFLTDCQSGDVQSWISARRTTEPKDSFLRFIREQTAYRQEEARLAQLFSRINKAATSEVVASILSESDPVFFQSVVQALNSKCVSCGVEVIDPQKIFSLSDQAKAEAIFKAILSSDYIYELGTYLSESEILGRFNPGLNCDTCDYRAHIKTED